MGPKPMLRGTKRGTSEQAIGQRRNKSDCIFSVDISIMRLNQRNRKQRT
ncbi:hypothetical protein RchiOBHm_Chr4g0394061 [Rosa chinensis]|uniref:Uncharacterized protein n=1 Tax=Rosa chinensis TaxID=74649 RepID=A0A2P6QR50_ROSCH|nr:hypothetical protein RchiOBHm_Chr4g0394061 [Rosa chinensis]